MNEFTWLFVATLARAGGVELWLTARQARAVVAHRDRVPAAFQQRISLAAHQTAADYTLAKLRVERIEIGDGALLTLAWTLGGGLATLGALWSIEGTASIWRDTAFMLTAFLAMSLLSLPLALYRTFVIEARFGFNRIAPLCNRFVPLDDPALRQRIENLLQRCGFASDGVFVMDGSKRSQHGNAYFTGLGAH